MSTCNTCHKPRAKCGCSNVYSSKQPSTPDPYAHHHQPFYQPVPPTCLPNGDSCNYGSAQPIDRGVFQALNSCGEPVPYAQVTVVYAATNEKVPLYYRPVASPQYGQSNPVTVDEKGRAPIYFFSQGHDIKIIVECDDGNGNFTLIDSFIQYAATLQDNVDLSDLEDKECITIDNPRALVYDKDNCNKPAHFIDLRFWLIHSNIKTGLVAGAYSDVKAYYECLGEPFADGVKVYGECSDCPEVYIYKGTCDQECPPNPCDVEYDENGDSVCWTMCLDADTDPCDNVVEQPGTDATHALDCVNGDLVRRPVSTVPADFGATMALNGLTAGQDASEAEKDLDGIIYEDDPTNILEYDSGGIRVLADGLYIMFPEIGTSINSGMIESALYINGVKAGQGFANSGSYSDVRSLGMQAVVYRLSANDLVKTGVGNNVAVAGIDVGNLSVTYLGE